MRHKALVGLLAAAVYSVSWRRLLGGFAPSFVGPSLRGRRLLRSTNMRAAAVSTDPCTLLGLPPGTRDESEVRSAFRRLAKMYHPDVPETGDQDKFQALQEAASQLLEGGDVPYFDIAEAFKGRKTSFAPRRKSVWTPPEQNGHTPSIRPEDAKTYGAQIGPQLDGRVVVEDVMARKRSDLIKVNEISREPCPASTDTLRRVQEIVGENMEVPAEEVDPEFPLELLFPMEGDRNIGAKVVADVLLDLENEFGIELIVVMVRTWVRSKLPADVLTVNDLADLLEAGAAPENSIGVQETFPEPAPMPAPSPMPARQVWSPMPAPQAQQQVAPAVPQTPPQPAPEQPLPAPWEKHWSSEYRRHYFWNPATEESLWEPPSP